jgi:hypothetical protein
VVKRSERMRWTGHVAVPRGGVAENIYFTTGGQSVSQYVLVSATPLGPMTGFFFFISFAGQLLCSSSWGALSDERTGL